MAFIHKRGIIIRSIKEVRLRKSITIEVGLNRTKDWVLTVPNLEITCTDNLLTKARSKIMDLLYEIHLRYLNNTLSDPVLSIYKESVVFEKVTQKQRLDIIREEKKRIKNDRKEKK